MWLAFAHEHYLTLEHFFEQNSNLPARKKCAKAKMWPTATKRKLRVACACDVELLRVGERGIVEVCRRVPHHYFIAGINVRVG